MHYVMTRDRKKKWLLKAKKVVFRWSKIQNKWWKSWKKGFFNLYFPGFTWLFVQTATATETGKAKCASVAVNGFSKVPWCECNCNRDKFCLCLCCSCSCGSAFLKPLTATETNLVAVAVATRQFGGNHQTFPENQQKKVIFWQKWQNIFFPQKCQNRGKINLLGFHLKIRSLVMT